MNMIISFTSLVSTIIQNQTSRVKLLFAQIATTGALIVITACTPYNQATGRFAQTITPYQITISQGNFVSKEMAAQLQTGMSRDDVKNLLGTPLVADIFHADRWDYIFYIKRGTQKIVEKRGLSLQFAEDRLHKWSDINSLPSEKELVAMIDSNKYEKRNKKYIVKKETEALQSQTAANSLSDSLNKKDLNTAPNQRASAETNEALVAPSQLLQSENLRATSRTSTPPAPMPQHPIPDAQLRLKMPVTKPARSHHALDNGHLTQPPKIAPTK